MLRATVCCVIALVVALAAAQTIPYDSVSGRTPVMPFNGNLADGEQYIVRDGVDTGDHWWTWNQIANTAQLNLFFSGLPTSHLTYDTTLSNPNNAYNQFPLDIHLGKWRLAIVHHMGEVPITFYRWANGTLAGSEYDYYGHANLPHLHGVYTEQNVASIMLMTDLLNVRAGTVKQSFNFHYGKVLDFMGTTGVVYGHVNVTDGDISTMINIYSNPNTMVKPAPAFSFSDILADINAGGAVGILPTYQPLIEPANLRGRDSLFRGPFAMWTAGLSGPFGPRLADTATCAAAYAGTPAQQANPYDGDVQLTNWFTSACILSMPDTSKRSVQPQFVDIGSTARGLKSAELVY